MHAKTMTARCKQHAVHRQLLVCLTFTGQSNTGQHQTVVYKTGLKSSQAPKPCNNELPDSEAAWPDLATDGSSMFACLQA